MVFEKAVSVSISHMAQPELAFITIPSGCPGMSGVTVSTPSLTDS